MAESSLAFQDDFTKSHGGQCYFVSVDPVFEDQITEVVTLVARARPENVRVSYISQFVAAAKAASPSSPEDDDEATEQDAEVTSTSTPKKEDSEEVIEAKRKVIKDLISSLKSLRLESTDKEFEGFSNLLLSLILSLFPSSHPDFPTLILILVDSLSFSADRTANPSLSARYFSITTVFNSLATSHSTLRLSVLLKLINYAAQNDDFAVIVPALSRLQSWIVEWGFGKGTSGEEEGNAAIASVTTTLINKGKLSEARQLLIAHLSAGSAVGGTSTTVSASTSQLATKVINLSLALPTVYDFSSLSTLSGVSSPSIPQLSTLLTIFQTGDVASFTSFATSEKTVLEEQKLDVGQLEQKLKLLALAELCSKRVGEFVSYEEIAEALKLSNGAGDDGEEVEIWVIDAIRASLINGRLSQSLSSFHVTRAAPRSFTSTHWTLLEQRLQGWRTSLDNILESVGKGVGAGLEGANELVQGEKEKKVEQVQQEEQKSVEASA